MKTDVFPKKVLEKLKKTRELLDDPNQWTQGGFARNNKKKFVSSNDSTAVCWCLLGAIHRVCAGESNTTALIYAVRKSLQDFSGGYSLADLNDFASHEEIVDILDTAIEKYKF